MEMQVLEFIWENEDWEEKLAAEPYYIESVWDGDYVLLRYNQLASDFNEPMVRECRGAIFHLPEKDHQWASCVCYPFSKFGNYGETYVPDIDWSTARVMEKVDGSLIKMWWHLGEWHISTNNTIDASKAFLNDGFQETSFQDIVMEAITAYQDPATFFKALHPGYFYMFELVSPRTRVVIKYPHPQLYFLGMRHKWSLDEVDMKLEAPCLKYPVTYPLFSLNECISAAALMSRDEEGFVVCDNKFNRVKIKSPEYLIAAKLRNNNVITVRNLVEMIKAGTIDDFMAYADDHASKAQLVIDIVCGIAKDCDYCSEVAERLFKNTGIDFHILVSKHIPKQFQDYCYKKHTGRATNSIEYVKAQYTSTLVDWIKERIKPTDKF